MQAESKEPGLSKSRGFFLEMTLLTRFALHFFREMWRPRYEIRETLRQAFLAGNKSLPLVGVTGFIMGLVLTIQSRPTLQEFGAESWLPAMVGISIVREIGPVITSIICAGKIGSGIGAELASMKVTEQIDSMEASGLNPFKYIVVTRIIATTFMIPLLAIFADAIALTGSYVGVNIKGDITFQLFFSQVFEKLHFSDILPAFIKTFFFGFTIGLISTYKGYTTNMGTEGVGRAANWSVVIASLLVFVIDMVAAQITDSLLH